ncbi:hypothetical protein [Deinococcus hohokamensis]|uniref:Uncharacterized protein n=1 Tax=Deinococcus hohokamensis TaxID=309883 RepID=A0ABV9ICK2_9DEIO
MDVVMRRQFRTQVQVGHLLLGLAIFLALPVPKPSLWPLEIWGEFQVPGFVWPAIFAGVALVLLRTRRSRLAMLGMMAAAVLFVTVAVASYLGIGPNALTLVAGISALHCTWTARDLKGVRGSHGD